MWIYWMPLWTASRTHLVRRQRFLTSMLLKLVCRLFKLFYDLWGVRYASTVQRWGYESQHKSPLEYHSQFEPTSLTQDIWKRKENPFSILRWGVWCLHQKIECLVQLLQFHHKLILKSYTSRIVYWNNCIYDGGNIKKKNNINEDHGEMR